MSDTNAKNVGAVINNPTAPINITNNSKDGRSQLLPCNILSPNGFVGRTVEFEELRNAYAEDKRTFVLHGLGGVGKSALARKFIEVRKPDYQAFIEVEMKGLSDTPLSPKEVMLSVIRAFNAEVDANLDEAQIKSLYVSLLSQHETVLFLDNAKDRSQVEPLNVSANVLLVVTSRENFVLTGGKSKLINSMSLEDAKSLLFSIADEERFNERAEELANLAGCLPMALLPLASILAEDITENAVSLIKKYSVRKELLRLEDPNRENLSVQASFDLSYERLSDELKKRWRKLGIFNDDFDDEGAKAIWKDKSAIFASGLKVKNVKESLSALVKSNLIIFASETGRFRLHDLARNYTFEKLKLNEIAETERFHAFYYGLLLDNLGKLTLTNLVKFDLERSNIEYGFEWVKNNISLNRTIAELCLVYMRNSSDILTLRLHSKDYKTWLETGLLASRKIGDRYSEGGKICNLGTVFKNSGNYRQAIECFEQALAIFKEIGYREGIGTILNNLGNSYLGLGDNQQAVKCFQKALLIARQINDRRAIGVRLGNLGTAYLSQSKTSEAIENFKQSLVISKEIGDLQGTGLQLGNLGIAYLSLYNYKEAINYTEQTLAISEKIGDLRAKGKSLCNLGIAYAALNDNQKAIEYFLQALTTSREIGDRHNEGLILNNLASAYAILGDKDTAETLLQEALALFEDIESPNAIVAKNNLIDLN